MPNIAALKALAERWAGAEASERANFPPYLIGLCEALGVEPPGPAGSGYQFELDALVARAYGWEWPLEREVILERLVARHDERVREEKAGKVRWLRGDYQVPRFGKDLPAEAPALGLVEAAAKSKPAKRPPWPGDVISQIGAIKQLLAENALSVDEIVARFAGAKAEIVRRHLDILQVMGEVRQNPDERYQVAVAAVLR